MGQRVLMDTIASLANIYITDSENPSTYSLTPTGEDGCSHGLAVQAWGEFRYRNGQAALEPPSWHIPIEEEVG